MSSIGERIKKRRTELGWTQEFICTKVGLSKSFFSELESGKRSVSAENLLNIARTLSVSLDYLMTGTASEEPPKGLRLGASYPPILYAHSIQYIHIHT